VLYETMTQTPAWGIALKNVQREVRYFKVDIDNLGKK